MLHTCSCCPPLLEVANIVLQEGSCPLRKAFDITSPGVKYDTEKARRKLFVMPFEWVIPVLEFLLLC